MEQRHVRGHLMRGAARFALNDLAPPAREEVRRSVPDLSTTLDEIRKDDWYPLGRLIELITTIDRTFPEPERGLAAILTCGKYIAEEGVSTYLKLVMKVITPRLFVRQFPTLWKRYHDFGELSVDVGDIEHNRATLIMPAYPGVRGLCSGWIEYAFGLFKTRVTIDTNWPWRAPTPERLEMRLAWD
jgi:hypothetical protein